MADYYTLLTNAGIAYENACKAAGVAIKLTQMSVGDGNGAVYNPAATATALKREVWRGPLNALFQDEKNPSWLLAEITIPPEVGGWYVREAGLWTDTGILYAIVKYPESFKPVLATSGSGKEFYIRSIFETSNASEVTLLIDDNVVKATRAWVVGYVADELAKLDNKQSVRAAAMGNIVLSGAQTIDGVALVAGQRVLVAGQAAAKDNGIYVVANGAWVRASDANSSAKVTPAMAVSVEEGATLADTRWQLVTDGAIVLGTTALTFQNVTQGFAPLNSPALINPTGNTPGQFDISKLLANTEFVKRMGVEYSSFTSNGVNTALSALHVGGMHSFSGATLLVATLPPTAGVAQGATISLVCSSGGGLNIQPAAGDALYTSIGSVGSIALGVADTAEFVRIDTQWRLLGGSAALKYSAMMLGANWLTQPQFDSGKSFATTEFVQRALGSLSGATDIGSNVFANAGHVGKHLNIGAGNSYLPATAGIAEGSVLHYKNTGIGDHTLSRVGADVISCNGSSLASIVIGTGEDLELVRVGSNWIGSGTAALKYTAAFMASFGVSGYQKLPSGLIFQWGSTGVTTTSVNATFPVAFPNRCAWICSQDNGGAPSVSIWTFSLAGNAFTAHNIGSLNKGSAAVIAAVASACAWFAVGY